MNNALMCFQQVADQGSHVNVLSEMKISCMGACSGMMPMMHIEEEVQSTKEKDFWVIPSSKNKIS